MAAERPYRLLISGGGTGGHVFPAIAIASEFRSRFPDAEILFVGALGKMEMTRVPAAGFRIIGLWISGLQRSLSLSNLLFPVKLLVSYLRAIGIVRSFRPHVVVGTGGYASGPVMLAALRAKLPALIQEQNSFAGLTNKRLASGVHSVCVAFEGMERYFPADRIRITGNPVRQDIRRGSIAAAEARRGAGLDAERLTLLVLGGSLGARTINETVLAGLSRLVEAGIQIWWQTGRFYFDDVKRRLNASSSRHVRLVPFIDDMNAAYHAADLVVSRAGALSIAELAVAGKPAILVPSPNVAEDHQTRNAEALLKQDAAVLIGDAQAGSQLVAAVIALAADVERRNSLSLNISALARPDATSEIVDEVVRLLNQNRKAL